MINPKDISVVVQGAVGKDTRRCLRSVRRYLPGAEIILSTWNGTNVDGLDYDKLVLSDDPGTIIRNSAYQPNNINRQLISTQAGVAAAKRKYTLKLRADLFLQSTKFLKYFDKFPKRNDKYSIFKHRVIISTIYSREKYKKEDFLFHPYDFWLFGLTDDICDYWVKTPQISYKAFSPKKQTFLALFSNNTNFLTHVPEQWYCINWVKRHFPDVVFDDYSDDNPDAKDASHNILYNNFTFIGPYQSGIWSKKHKKAYRNEYSIMSEIDGLITYELFQQRYKELCDNNYVPVPDKYKYLFKFRQNLEFLYTPFKNIIRYLIRISRVIWYLGLFIVTGFKQGKN